MIKDLPQALVSKYSMAIPNEPVVIYSGEYQLVRSPFNYVVTGEIKYNWFPKLGLCFSGKAANNPVQIMLNLDNNEDEKIRIIVNKEEFGQCLLTSCESNGLVAGFFVGNIITGEKNINVENVDFLI
ncbi:MAG: hypothetical protein IT258_03710, partial [Saprospiraceae bacterium]|nr:hypothetical protein [Saprospiraceae bacterium]